MDNNQGLSLIDKLKLIVGLKSLAGQIQATEPNNDPNQLKTSIWSKLDGTKSITGLLMIIAYYALPQFGIKVPDIFLKIGIAWAGVGFMHKFDKATNILTAVMTALIQTKDTINGDKK